MINEREISPKLLADVTVALFTECSIKALLEERLLFYRFSAEDAARIMMKDPYFSRSHSLESCESLARAVIDYVSNATAWNNSRHGEIGAQLNVLDLFLVTIQDLLVMNQNRIESRYAEIESWRKIVRYMGEELALSARYAKWDHEHNKGLRSRFDEFDWPYVTGHNNKQLNSIVRRGVSDHHNHLWGSTPYFHVSWVNLMNNLLDSEYRRNLKKLSPKAWSVEEEHWRRKGADRISVKENYWEIAQTRAAWIRRYLCERLMGTTDATLKHYELENIRDYENWRLLLLSRGRLQSEMDAYAHMMRQEGDYVLSIAKLKKRAFAPEYHHLIGERWLYYRIFRDYCKPPNERQLKLDDYNLFFVYFLIRLRVRKQMVQNNDYIGFDNFRQIEQRKMDFLGDKESVRVLSRLAVTETLKKKPYIKELEVRISPFVEQIGQLEQAIQAQSGETSVDRFLRSRSEKHSKEAGANLEDRFYYVFHFLKRRDPQLEPNSYYQHNKPQRFVCRHHEQRQLFLKQAREIIKFREEQPLLARRVLGIDAASREIGCRPEVFGTVYRLLGDHQSYYGGYMEERRRMPALGKTYHVGEDFPDVINGLRAIDEVLRFLDFDCGDRLGHAIVLGVNVEEWYEQRNREVSVSVQEHLDDLAWFYHALVHYSIDNIEPLKERLKRDFDYWFRIVYRNNINEDSMQMLMQRAKQEWYDRTREDHDRYHEHICHFDIMDYYRAWTLRGDDPECYIDGYFKKPFGIYGMVPEERAKVCEKFPPNYDDRYISEYSFLNYLYQFHEKVRKEGSRKIKVPITEEYICAAKMVQIKMRYDVASRGISIETNPTSNVLIGTFRKYEKHPILSFYNRGLPVTEQEERDCAQLQVSINTDDSGVFYTDLETEYALLAHSVERILDEDAKQRFKKADIYAWLDHIRMMGNDQSFRLWYDRSV